MTDTVTELTSPKPNTQLTPPTGGRFITALLAGLLLLSLAEAVAMMLFGTLHGNDFKHLWAGALLLAHGRNPYEADEILRVTRLAGLGGINPYVYLPTTVANGVMRPSGHRNCSWM